MSNKRQRTSNNSKSEVVFEYTGGSLYHEDIPQNVTHVRIDSSVTKIDDDAFFSCKRFDRGCIE